MNRHIERLQIDLNRLKERAFEIEIKMTPTNSLFHENSSDETAELYVTGHCNSRIEHLQSLGNNYTQLFNLDSSS
jgi:hypothetical protein